LNKPHFFISKFSSLSSLTAFLRYSVGLVRWFSAPDVCANDGKWAFCGQPTSARHMGVGRGTWGSWFLWILKFDLSYESFRQKGCFLRLHPGKIPCSTPLEKILPTPVIRRRVLVDFNSRHLKNAMRMGGSFLFVYLLLPDVPRCWRFSNPHVLMKIRCVYLVKRFNCRFPA